MAVVVTGVAGLAVGTEASAVLVVVMAVVMVAAMLEAF